MAIFYQLLMRSFRSKVDLSLSDLLKLLRRSHDCDLRVELI